MKFSQSDSDVKNMIKFISAFAIPVGNVLFPAYTYFKLNWDDVQALTNKNTVAVGAATD